MRILLTGVNGFLGKALAAGGMKRGYTVIGLMREGASFAPEASSIIRYAAISELHEIIKECRPDVLIHVAGSYGRRGETLESIRSANVLYGQALMEAYAATNGSTDKLFLNTGTALGASVSDYAATKREFSKWAKEYSAQVPRAPKYIDIELQQMYGPGDDEKKLPAQIIAACLARVPYMDFTAAEQLRDFIYIDDVVAAYYCIIQNQAKLKSGTVLPLGGGAPVTVKEFALEIKALTRSQMDFRFGVIPYRPNEPMCLTADISKLRRLGWTPCVDLRAGLAATIKYAAGSEDIALENYRIP